MTATIDRPTFLTEPAASSTGIQPAIDARNTAASEMTALPRPLTGMRRLRAGRATTPYVRVMVLTLLVNAVAAAAVFASGSTVLHALSVTLTATTINVAVAVLCRQEYVVNGLFRVATAAPTSWPLRVRAGLAKVYHFGGIHAGAAISATAWFAAFAGLVLSRSESLAADHLDSAVAAVTVLILLDLMVICVCARPSMRERRHNVFEATHRYGGWIALVLFGVLAVLMAALTTTRGRSIDGELAESWNVWLLVVVVVCISIPWLQLRRVPMQVATPSDHVVLAKFEHGRASAGSFARLSTSALGQSHSFATIPTPGSHGYRVAISKAGDWTARTIADTPATVWVRGVPTAGVATVAALFNRVVWVATGSGIAPCLPHLLTGDVPAQLVWVTRNPERTYGRALLDEIRAAQPDAVIWDTDALGKPDLAALTYAEYKRSGAEAVICISNKSTTLGLVTDLRARGVQAYGPIWDS